MSIRRFAEVKMFFVRIIGTDRMTPSNITYTQKITLIYGSVEFDVLVILSLLLSRSITLFVARPFSSR